MTEAALMAAVIELAQVLRYKCAHFTPAQVRGAWMTAGTQGTAGFPDLVIAGHGLLLFVELKTARGRLSPAQVEWACALKGTGVQHYCWRPADWTSGAIEAVLRGATAKRKAA